MKKLVKLLLVSLLVLGLAGCKDATANVSDKNTVMMTIGKNKITKGDLYQKMMADDAANTVINMALETIANKEIETTDAIKKAGQDKFDGYKKDLTEDGDDFLESLKAMGFDSEEEFLNYCITLAKEEALSDKYIEDNFDSLFDKYKPVQARIMFFDGTLADSSVEKAKANAESALAEVKGGASFSEVAKKYNSKDSLAAETLYTNDDDTLDSNVILYMFSTTTPGLSNVITNKDAKGFYIVQVTNMNKEQIRSNFTTHLKQEDDFADTVHGHFFEKYNFRVYDIDVYNTIKKNYPSYLVQK